MTFEIGVVTPTHPRRIVNGMLARAMKSALLDQSIQPSALCVYNDTERRGAPFARQRALEMNTCEWTAFLDSDDEFGPEHLRILRDAQLDTGADYVYSWYWLNRAGNTVDGVFPPTHFTEPWDENKPRQTTITVLVRTELARMIGFWEPSDDERFPDGHRVGEDYNFTLECNRLGKIHHVVERTWIWHHHGGNTSGRATLGDAR